ncbi:hypothetical protein [Mucilaginibacter panaciglaebae]|uniref:RNA-binding protein n=1 Tax=Mucilaginibacter panaciglaebae TaxID=502331 RepID=A0ABP7WJH6_9SPHI
MKIFIAKLPHQYQSADVTELFSPYGEVSSANVIMDRETGRSKCYAFVEMPDENEAQNAINNLNGKSILDKEIAVSQAKEKERTERPGGGGGGYRSGGGGGYNRNSGGGGYRGNNSGGGYNRERGTSGYGSSNDGYNRDKNSGYQSRERSYDSYNKDRNKNDGFGDRN